MANLKQLIINGLVAAWLIVNFVLVGGFVIVEVASTPYLLRIPTNVVGDNYVSAVVEGTTSATIQPIFTLDDYNLQIDTGRPILTDGTSKYFVVQNTQTANQYIYSVNQDGELNWKSLAIEPVNSNIIISPAGGVMFRSGENLKYVNNTGSIIVASSCFDKTSPQSMIALDSTNRLIVQNLGSSEKEIVVCKDGTEIWSIARPSQATTQPLVLGAQTTIPNTQTSAFAEWKYRNKLTINNLGNPNTLIDYQVSLTINTQELISAGKMQSNCADIRFADSDGQTPLNYWVEGPCNSIATKIWVKVPKVLAVNTTDIYIYFGNHGATDNSSTLKTFVREVGDAINLKLRGSWNFDEQYGSNAFDLSGYGADRVVPTFPRVSGKYGNALDFTGYLLSSAPIERFYSSFAFEAWIYPRKSVSVYCSYCNVNDSPVLLPMGGDIGPQIIPGDPCWNANRLNVGVGLMVGTNGMYVMEHGACYLYNRVRYVGTMTGWQHIVMVYDDNKPLLYLNGVLVSEGYRQLPMGFLSHYIGGNGYLGLPDYLIDEVREYQGVISAEEISDIFNNYGFASPYNKGKLLVRKYSVPEPVIINNVSDSTINMSEGNVYFNSSVLGAAAYDLESIQPNVQTVTPIWTNSIQGLNTVTIEGENIYSTDLSNVLYSTNKETGVTNWSLPIGTSQPLITVSENVVYVLHSKDQYDGNTIYALDVQTGQNIWTYKLTDEINPQSLILDEGGNLNLSEGNHYLVISPQGVLLIQYQLNQDLKLQTIENQVAGLDQNSMYQLKPITNTIRASRNKSTINFEVKSSILKRETNAHYDNQMQLVFDDGHIVLLRWVKDESGLSIWRGKLFLSTTKKDQTEFTGALETIIANYQGVNETHFARLPENFMNKGVVQKFSLTTLR